MKKLISLALVLCLILALGSGISFAAPNRSSIDPEAFMDPGVEYRPGVRWWLPGGSVDADLITQQVQWLYDNGFGSGELNPFGKDTSSVAPLTQTDKDAYLTDEYYKAIAAAFAKADTLGFQLDLNMGSGWNANDPRLDVTDSQKNMAIGRTKVTVSAGQVTTAVPIPLASHRSTNKKTWPVAADGTYDSNMVTLEMVVVAPITGETANSVTSGRTLTGDALGRTRYTLNMVKAQNFDMKKAANKTEIVWNAETDGDYLVCSVYSYNSKERPVADSANTTNGIIVDHFDPNAVANYMDLWLGDPRLKSILDKYPNVIGHYFNDSYEFAVDTYYNDLMYELAKDSNKNGLGYDFSKYLPLVYQGSNDGAYQAQPSGLFQVASTVTAVQNRIVYDFNQLQNTMMLEGMRAFQEKSHQYYGLYRQQPYNPPFLDRIGAGKYVDVPEGEQGNENNMRGAGSAAHLYGRNEASSEQFTLGNTPYTVTPSTIKTTIDMQLTSGVNNFRYHGYNLEYKGTPTQEANTVYGETGYNAMFTIGVYIHRKSALDYKAINTYIARGQYLMKQGNPSADIALYVPNSVGATNSVNSTSNAAGVLNQYGFVWDAINNDSILNARYENGRIRMGYSDMHYGALIVQNDTVPINVMKKLLDLAKAGANVIFYMLPTTQPSYLDGNYDDGDAQVVALRSEIMGVTGQSAALNNATNLVATLQGTKGPISYDNNSNVRLARRTLVNGGEVSYFRNTSTSAATTISIIVNDNTLVNHYLLDSNTGKIHPIAAVNGKISITLGASGAIALLSEPAGTTIAIENLTYGLPDFLSWQTLDKIAMQSITTFDLTVIADNLGGSGTYPAGTNPSSTELARNGYLKNGFSGDTDTRTFSGIALGNWNSATYLGGAMRYVGAPVTYSAKFNIDGAVPNSYFIDLGTVYNSAQVTVNGKTFAALTSSPYVVDIGKALKAGVNDLSITVRPVPANRYAGFNAARSALSAGVERNMYQLYTSSTTANAGLVGPVTLYKGPDKGIFASIQSDTTSVTVNSPVSYTVSIENAWGTGVVEVSFMCDGYILDKDSITATPLNGFALGVYPDLTFQYMGQGLWKGTVKYMYLLNDRFVNTNDPLDIMKISGTAIDIGSATVTITDFSVQGDNGAGLGTMPSLIWAADATTAVGSKPAVYSKYDLNKDGSIDETDLLYLVYFYQWNDRDVGWDTVDLYGIFAKDCDFQVNGKVDLADMIELTANYGIYDPYA